MGTDNCSPEATCTNTEGSFTRTCNQDTLVMESVAMVKTHMQFYSTVIM